MDLNERARKKVAGDLAADETLSAIVRAGTVVSGSGAAGRGTTGSSTTVFSLPYAEAQGITFDDDRLRFDPHAFAPFGHGAHKCLGIAFAMLEIKAFLCALLPRYRIERCDELSLIHI